MKQIGYYIFDLAPCSLFDFFQHNYTGKMPSDGEALKQMAKGLFYIHRQQFVHRDIKPSNILISKNEPVKLMLANFSLCKAITDLDTYSIESGKNGDEKWMAPEILECFDEDVDYD